MFAINYKDGVAAAAGGEGGNRGGSSAVIPSQSARVTATDTYVGIYAVSTARVTVPLTVAGIDGTTFVVYDGNRTAAQTPSVVQLDVGSASWTSVSFFGASPLQLSVGGLFWDLKNQNVKMQITFANGQLSVTMHCVCVRTGCIKLSVFVRHAAPCWCCCTDTFA